MRLVHRMGSCRKSTKSCTILSSSLALSEGNRPAATLKCLTMPPRPSDLVLDSKIRVEFHADSTHRFSFESSKHPSRIVRRKERRDVWKREEHLGRGSFGEVWSYRCLRCLPNGKTPELQAVKMVSKPRMADCGINYYKELEAIAKFSQPKVRCEHSALCACLTVISTKACLSNILGGTKIQSQYSLPWSTSNMVI